MSGAASTFKWGLTLPIVVVALAVAYRLQQQPFGDQSTIGRQDPIVYCSKGVRTHDPEQPAAQCFSVVDGIFKNVWMPADDGATAGAQLLDGYVMPGLWDGHGHLLHYGEFLHSVDLFGSETLDDVRSRTKAYLASNPGAGSKDNWVRGVGWDQTFFGRMPTAADFEQDEDLRGIYMMLDRIDVHCTWVSQAVLDLLPADLPDTIPGGEIIREPGMGVFCDNAMDMVMELWPKPGPETKALHVKSAMRKLNEVGLVGMHDAGTTPGNLVLYSELADTDDWTLRVYAMLECEQRNTYCPDEAVKFSRDDHRFSVRSVKLFADGALGSWGSAMIEPYTDHPWTSGSMLINASALTDVTKRWAADGYQVNIHAIGDLANRNAVDALEAALAQECPEDAAGAGAGPGPAKDGDHPLAGCQDRHRFRIEHSQIIHPDDQRRIHSLGILPSIQPTHATSDMKYALDRLGEHRLARSAYRMRSLLPARPVLGSDFPVEPPNPFHGIYAAVARKNPATGHGADGGPDGWYMDEALTLDEALWGFTGAPAHGAFLDGRAGVIKEGALADWVVLDQPVESFGVEGLRALTVKETWVAGKKVYSRPE